MILFCEMLFDFRDPVYVLKFTMTKNTSKYEQKFNDQICREIEYIKIYI